MSGRRRFLSGVKSGGGSDIVYGNQIVAWYEVTEDDWDDESGYYGVRLVAKGFDLSNIKSLVFEDGFYQNTVSEYEYFIDVGIKQIIFVFEDDCTDLDNLFGSVQNLTTLDFTNFNSSIVTNWHSTFTMALNLTEIIGTIYLDSASFCDGMFGGLPTQTPPLNSLSCVNFGMQENISGNFIFMGCNTTPIIWQEVFVKGAFDRRAAGYADCFIGYFNDSSFMTEEEQAIVKAKGYTWDYD